MQAIEELPAQSAALVPISRIRVETAFSRFPIHRLAKKDLITIDLQQSTGDGDIKWEVAYNQKHGQPGPLAYKVDTLIVNRRIDESGRPLPGVIKLGSLTELCTALCISDSGENRANLKKALHQNASAYITAKIRYRTKTGKERWSEIGYTRYSVIFTGEMLPDGAVADAVHIVPNASYRELLNHVEMRPLDYDYLTQLAPGPQRFYELLSFQVYGALAGGRPRAKLVYSDYCDHAPQVRYMDFDRVKKQLYKLHVPHRSAGYIVKIDYQQAVDANGNPDWEMLYTPGPKAVAEFEAFTRRQIRQSIDNVALPKEEEGAALVTSNVSVIHPLLTELSRRGISLNKSNELLANLKPDQEVMDQLEYVDSLIKKDSRGRLENPPGLYVMYIRDNILPPAEFPTSRKRKLIETSRHAKEFEIAKAAQRKLDYEAYCEAEISRYITEMLSAEQYQEMLEKDRNSNRRLFSDMPEDELEMLSVGTVRSQIKYKTDLKLMNMTEFLNIACRISG